MPAKVQQQNLRSYFRYESDRTSRLSVKYQPLTNFFLLYLHLIHTKLIDVYKLINNSKAFFSSAYVFFCYKVNLFFSKTLNNDSCFSEYSCVSFC